MGCGKSRVKKLTEDEMKIIESGHHNGHLDGIPNPANQEVVNSVTASLNSPARASLDDSPSAEDLNDPGFNLPGRTILDKAPLPPILKSAPYQETPVGRPKTGVPSLSKISQGTSNPYRSPTNARSNLLPKLQGAPTVNLDQVGEIDESEADVDDTIIVDATEGNAPEEEEAANEFPPEVPLLEIPEEESSEEHQSKSEINSPKNEEEGAEHLEEEEEADVQGIPPAPEDAEPEPTAEDSKSLDALEDEIANAGEMLDEMQGAEIDEADAAEEDVNPEVASENQTESGEEEEAVEGQEEVDHPPNEDSEHVLEEDKIEVADDQPDSVEDDNISLTASQKAPSVAGSDRGEALDPQDVVPSGQSSVRSTADKLEPGLALSRAASGRSGAASGMLSARSGQQSRLSAVSRGGGSRLSAVSRGGGSRLSAVSRGSGSRLSAVSRNSKLSVGSARSGNKSRQLSAVSNKSVVSNKSTLSKAVSATSEGGGDDRSPQTSRRRSDVEQTEAEEAGDDVDEQAEVGETGQDSQSIVQEPEEGDPKTGDQDEDRPTTANEEADDDVKDDGNTEEGEKVEEEDYDTDIPITNLGPGAESLSHQEIAV